MARVRTALAPAELQLVLLSACGEWADERMRAILGEELHWPSVLAVARWEQASFVLLRRLEALNTKNVVPSRELSMLESAGAVEDFRMALLEERLRSFVGVLYDHGIEVVLLKGSGIALGWYGRLSDRPMGDLDILVRTDEAPRAHRLARSLNWIERGGRLDAEMYSDMQHLLPLKAKDGLGFGLEIHTDLFPAWSPFNFSAADVWERARPLPGLPASVPAPEHQLLHACLHFAWSHCFRKGTWRAIRDVDALLDDSSVAPSGFANLARIARGASCAYWTFALVHELTGRDVPQELMTALDVPLPPLMSRILLRHLVSEGLPGSGAPGTRSLRRTLWSLAIRPRKSGHDGARPWEASDRWPQADEIPLAAESMAGTWTDRLKGLLGYSGQLAGLRRP